MKNTKIKIGLSSREYGDGKIVDSVLNKKFGFELNIENEFERNRRILTLEQLVELRNSIDRALEAFNEVSK